MDYYKIINRTAQISANKRNIVDLEAEIWSQDLNVTKFVLALETTGPAIDLTNATVRVAMVYNQDGTDVKIEAAGIVEDVATQKIAYIMDNRLAGFEGQVAAGFYVTLSTGQRIDIQNVTFNVRKSLLDKDLEPAKESYYQTFDDIVADVQNTGNAAKMQIANVLPSVQSKVSAINTELAKIDENMPDLFVAYADDINGNGFNKTDNTKLYKGFGVKNSTNPSDYRWEVNPNNLKIVGDNLIVNGYGEFKDNTNFNGYVFDGLNSYNNRPSFRITALNVQKEINDNLIEIDINKAYEFSMNIKSDSGGKIFLGWDEYDTDGKYIAAHNVKAFSQTTTSLVRDLHDGDTIIYLDTTADWFYSDNDYQNGLIFWNYRDSTGYLYPEGVYSRNVWFDLYTKENVNKTNNTITLKSPWNHGTIPAGTRVSQSDAGGHKYRNFEYTSVPTSWANSSFRIGEDHRLQSAYNFDYARFSPAAKSIAFLALWSFGEQTEDTYYINSIELKCIDNELMLLTANPINSILTTLSSENPSTTLGGTWVQLGNETKFSNTIYYWKRTQ